MTKKELEKEVKLLKRQVNALRRATKVFGEEIGIMVEDYSWESLYSSHDGLKLEKCPLDFGYRLVDRLDALFKYFGLHLRKIPPKKEQIILVKDSDPNIGTTKKK